MPYVLSPNDNISQRTERDNFPFSDGTQHQPDMGLGPFPKGARYHPSTKPGVHLKRPLPKQPRVYIHPSTETVQRDLPDDERVYEDLDSDWPTEQAPVPEGISGSWPSCDSIDSQSGSPEYPAKMTKSNDYSYLIPLPTRKKPPPKKWSLCACPKYVKVGLVAVILGVAAVAVLVSLLVLKIVYDKPLD